MDRLELGLHTPDGEDIDDAELGAVLADALTELLAELPSGSRIIESFEMSVLPRVLSEAGASTPQVVRVPFVPGCPDRRSAVARAVDLLSGGVLSVESALPPIGVGLTQVDDGSQIVLVVSGLQGDTISVADFKVQPGSDVYDLAVSCLMHLAAWGLPVDTCVLSMDGPA